MPEHLDVNALFREVPRAPERIALATGLFGVVEPWIGKPTVVAVYDHNDGSFSDQPWSSGSDVVQTGISETSSVRIYGDRDAGAAASLGIEEASGLACYSLSIPLPRLSHENLESMETVLLRIYQACTRFGCCVLIAGPELVVELNTSDFMGIVGLQLRNTSLITCIIGSESDLSTFPSEFAVVHQGHGIVVLRHQHARVRLKRATDS